MRRPTPPPRGKPKIRTLLSEVNGLFTQLYNLEELNDPDLPARRAAILTRYRAKMEELIREVERL
ncbi:MAG: hypothetical protein L0216_18860 [Planctomycetales bacterium]|nr:hypothetical protein [Planctomycetales bacterium]